MAEATGTIAGDSVNYPDDEGAVYAALVLGLRDFSLNGLCQRRFARSFRRR